MNDAAIEISIAKEVLEFLDGFRSGPNYGHHPLGPLTVPLG